MHLRKLFLVCLFFVYSNNLISNDVITIDDALNIYVYNTRYIRIQRMALENILMEYQNFKKSLLPAISLNFTPLSFNRSMRLLQNYKTGEYSNVEDFSNTTFGDMCVSQIIPATGGLFKIGSSLSYLREFSTNNNSFSSTPLYISYSQQLIGGRKDFCLQKEIVKLKYNVGLKQFCSSVSSEQQKILTMYLNAYSNLVDIDYYIKNVDLGDTLLLYATIRKNAGKITDYEYEQIKLHQLDNKIELDKAKYTYANSIHQLETELSLSNIELQSPSISKFPKMIDINNVLVNINNNNPTYLNLELERLNAEYKLHQTKLNNNFNANISLSYGLNQYGNELKDAYTHPNQRQALSVVFSVPIFQWGINNNKIKISHNEYESIVLEQEIVKDNFKEEIQNYVFNYNISYELFDIARKKYNLSGKQYSLAVMKYNVCKIAAIELKNAQKEYLQAKQEYLSVLKDLYVNYYKIRHISLYDYIDNMDMMEIIKSHYKDEKESIFK